MVLARHYGFLRVDIWLHGYRCGQRLYPKYGIDITEYILLCHAANYVSRHLGNDKALVWAFSIPRFLQLKPPLFICTGLLLQPYHIYAYFIPRGSFLERQMVDEDAFCFPQDDKRAKIEFYVPLVFYLFAFLVRPQPLQSYCASLLRSIKYLTLPLNRTFSCLYSEIGIPSQNPGVAQLQPTRASALPPSSLLSLGL